jgi:pyrroloquinoline quinone biosynthesis protein B
MPLFSLIAVVLIGSSPLPTDTSYRHSSWSELLTDSALKYRSSVTPQPSPVDTPELANPYVVVLGIAQDAGVPQAGSHSEPGWTDPDQAYLTTSLGLVDPESGKKWMFEATPDFRKQWYLLETMPPSRGARLPDGIFLTHAHIGHYTGLMFLGRESMGADNAEVYAMPEMTDFLSQNGPWDQLVNLQNIRIREMTPTVPVRLTDQLRVIPFLVPHRQEYSEVVGYRIEGPNINLLFLPDIDSWETWDKMGTRIEAVLQSVDVAYLDGSFFANGEIPGRDMNSFPHPFISHTIERLATLPDEQRQKVRFIHLNHTNPALRVNSPEAHSITAAGFKLARPMERVIL